MNLFIRSSIEVPDTAKTFKASSHGLRQNCRRCINLERRKNFTADRYKSRTTS
jgi:hypothetical protein